MSPRRMFGFSPAATLCNAQTSAPNFVVLALHVFAPRVALQFEELSMMMRTFGFAGVVLPVKMSMSSA